MIPIQLNTGEMWEASPKDLELWRRAYPAVNLDQELAEMAVWCDSNPSRRKTHRGVKAFVTKWLGRAQDQGGSPMAKQSGGSSRPSGSGGYNRYGGMRAMSPTDDRTDVTWFEGALKEEYKLKYLHEFGQYWDGHRVTKEEIEV